MIPTAEPRTASELDPILDRARIDGIIRAYGDLMRKNLRKRRHRRNLIEFSVRIRARDFERYLNVFRGEDGYEVVESGSERKHDCVIVETDAHKLEYLLSAPWHSDVIEIGYGAQFRIRSDEFFRKSGVKVCSSILTDYPNQWRSILRSPIRVARAVLSNMHYAVRAKQIFRGNKGGVTDLSDIDWLVLPIDEIRRRTGLPNDYADFVVPPPDTDDASAMRSSGAP